MMCSSSSHLLMFTPASPPCLLSRHLLYDFLDALPVYDGFPLSLPFSLLFSPLFSLLSPFSFLFLFSAPFFFSLPLFPFSVPCLSSLSSLGFPSFSSVCGFFPLLCFPSLLFSSFAAFPSASFFFPSFLFFAFRRRCRLGFGGFLGVGLFVPRLCCPP